MTETRHVEMSFETTDPALISEFLGANEPNSSGEVEIVPGVLATAPKVEGRIDIVGSEILATIAIKVVEGVATKLLVDLIVMLTKKYGAKLKINGKPVENDEKSVANELGE